MLLIASPVLTLSSLWEMGFGENCLIQRVFDLPSLKQAMASQQAVELLLDFDLPGLGGVSGIIELQKLSPTTRILVATQTFDPEEELSLLRAGVMGCVRKDINPTLLNRAVSVVRDGGIWITRSLIPGLIEDIRTRHGDPAVESPVSQNHYLQMLTPREQEIAILVSNGACNKHIARELNISERTVKAHLTTIFQKLGIADRLHLALYINGRTEGKPGRTA